MKLEARPGFFTINLAVWETRSKEQMMNEPPDSSVREVVRAFAYRHPHRIYYNPDQPSTIGRVALFTESDKQTPHRAYMQVDFALADETENTWRIFATTTPDILNHEIDRWRGRYSMAGDLVRNPSSVFQVTGTDGIFVHVGETDSGLITWRYILTRLEGTPITDGRIEVRENLDFPGIDLVRIAQPPAELLAYANFPTITR